MVTRRRVYVALVLSWCLAILVGSLPALGLHVTWEEACNRCALAQIVSTTFAVIFFITSVAGPLAVVVALYSILLVLAIKMHKARYGGSYTGRASARSSNFRLSFMSKRSLSTTKTSLSSSSSSSSSSKANRRMRRKDMEEYKKELKRRGAGPGSGGGNGGGGGGVKPSSPLSRISEGVELIDKTKNGASSDGADSDIGSPSPGVESLGKDGNGIWTVPMPSPGTPKPPVCVASAGEGTLNPVAYDIEQKNIGKHPQESSIPYDETKEDSATDPGVLHAEEVESETLKKQKNTLQKSSIPLNGVEGKTDDETEEDPTTGLEEPHEVRFAEERRTESIRKQKNTPQMSPVAFNGVETKVETDEEQTSDLEASHDLTYPEEQKAGTTKNQSLLHESPGALNGIGAQRETDEEPTSDLEAPHDLKSAEERQAGTQKNQSLLQTSPGAFNGIGTEGETDEVPNSNLEAPHELTNAEEKRLKKLKMPGKTAKLPVISNGSRTDEEVPSSPEAPHGTSDTEGTTTDEGEGEGKDKGEGRWRALFPSKYMNRVMVETRDKMLFLKKCRALKTVLLILISFTATYVPFVVGTLVYSAQKEKRPCLLHLLNTLLYVAVVANSLANPLIYAYGYREFRVKSEKFKGVFAREKPRNIS